MPVDRNILGWHPDHAVVLPDGHWVAGSLVIKECLPHGLAQRIARQLRVGNVYINRNMIGAVVGVQPFGGMGLSGTGPKAGGPHYLHRMATEQTITTNTAAIGGNAGLLSLAAR